MTRKPADRYSIIVGCFILATLSGLLFEQIDLTLIEREKNAHLPANHNTLAVTYTHDRVSGKCQEILPNGNSREVDCDDVARKHDLHTHMQPVNIEDAEDILVPELPPK